MPTIPGGRNILFPSHNTMEHSLLVLQELERKANPTSLSLWPEHLPLRVTNLCKRDCLHKMKHKKLGSKKECSEVPLMISHNPLLYIKQLPAEKVRGGDFHGRPGLE